MDKEKRTGIKPIPDDLKEVLNEVQWRALPGIVYSGWELRFFRRALFQEPVLVVHNTKDDRLGVLEKDGSINVQPEIKIRDYTKLDWLISTDFSI